MSGNNDLVIQIEITSNKSRIGKTALAIKLAQLLKDELPDVEVVIEDYEHHVRQRLLDNKHGNIIAGKIRIVDNPPYQESTYRGPVSSSDKVAFAVMSGETPPFEIVDQDHGLYRLRKSDDLQSAIDYSWDVSRRGLPGPELIKCDAGDILLPEEFSECIIRSYKEQRPEDNQWMQRIMVVSSF